MTHSYTLSGLTCTGCVARVKGALLKNPDITSAEVSLDPQQAVISMNRHLTVEQLQKSVSQAGHYTIFETSNTTMPGVETGWFATYKPLLLIFLFIIGVSLLSIDFGNPAWPTFFMTHFMAGFFLVFSFFKLLDLKGFANSYSMYDLLAQQVPSYGFIYPFLELGLGISYLIDFQPVWTNWATVVVMGFSSLGVIRSVLNKNQIHCACLGAVFNLPISTVTVVEDLLMVGMAGAMLLRSIYP